MLKIYVTSVVLVIALGLMTVTSARYLQDTDERLEKRTMSDQRLAELQALIALSRGQGIPIGHGHIDPWRIGKRKKRSVDSLIGSLDDEQKYRLANILMATKEEDQFS